MRSNLFSMNLRNCPNEALPEIFLVLLPPNLLHQEVIDPVLVTVPWGNTNLDPVPHTFNGVSVSSIFRVNEISGVVDGPVLNAKGSLYSSIASPHISMNDRPLSDMTSNDIKDRIRISMLDDLEKYSTLISPFHATDHPRSLDAVASVVLSFSKLG